MSVTGKAEMIKGATEGETEGVDTTTEALGVRPKTYRTRGLSYAVSKKKDQLNSTKRQLKSLTEKIQRMMEINDSQCDLRIQYSQWLSNYEIFLNELDDLKQMVGEDDRDTLLYLRQEHEESVYQQFKTSVEKWFSTKSQDEDILPPLITAGDIVSQASAPASQRSAGSSLSSARLRQQQRSVELATRAVSLKRRHELKLQKLKLKLAEEELEMNTELAVAEAQNELLNKLEQERTTGSCMQVPVDSTIHQNVTEKVKCVKDSVGRSGEDLYASGKTNYGSTCGKQISPDIAPRLLHSIPSDLRPQAPEFQPRVTPGTQVEHAEYYSPTNNLVRETNSYGSQDAFLAVVRQMNRPSPEIKKFSGDPFEYRKFMRQFNTKIVTNTDCDDDRMNFLDQFTAGEANKIVYGYSYLPAEQGYSAALAELEERYGDEEVIANAFVKRALSWPTIKADNPKALDEFCIFLAECENAVRTIQAIQVLEFPDNLKKLVGKLPYYCQDKWRALVQQLKASRKRIEFGCLVRMVRDEAKKVNDPTYGKDAMLTETRSVNSEQKRKQDFRLKGAFATNVAVANSPCNEVKNTGVSQIPNNAPVQSCLFCNNKQHCTGECQKLVALPYAEKIDFLKTKGACFGCLKRGHLKKQCRQRTSCKICGGNHPDVLHSDNFQPHGKQSPNTSTSDLSACAELSDGHLNKGEMRAGEGECTMAIVPVKVRIKNKTPLVETYAFLDPGSSVSFCSESLMRRLGGNGKRMRITLNTMGEPHTMETFCVEGLEMCDLDLRNVIRMPKVYTKSKMPVSSTHIPRPQEIDCWPHLADVELPVIPTGIDLLIGNNVPDAYSPVQSKTGPRGSPHATETLLGWVIWNLVRPADKVSENRLHTVNRAEVTAIEELEGLKSLDKLVREAINADFPERSVDEKREHSVEDKAFLSQVDQSITKVGYHYQIGLPFRNKDISLPDNLFQAEKRLQSLEKKLLKSSKFREDYTNFMAKLLEAGYAEEVPENEIDRGDGKIWYIPHHGVYHPKKLRVVFDCAAEYQGTSLNKLLLSGPDLTNSLLGVLVRFRKENVAVMGDIEAMFYQVLVPKDDTDCLRFLWWPNGDLNSQPNIFRMLVHLFGSISSPSCANSALLRTADDNEDQFDQEVATVIRSNFYVDDCLVSVESEEKAISLVREVTKLCRQGGFRLSKWVSNRHSVLESVEPGERNTGVKDLNLASEKLPNERALGVQWSVDGDTLGFSISPKEVTLSRRAILSTVSSIFDPLGLAAPFTLRAKILLQELCSSGLSWDAEVCGRFRTRWLQWMSDLPLLEQVQVQRCYKPRDFGKVAVTEIHIFCDASNVGYGMVSYMRLINDKGEIHCSLLMAKARVAPLKAVTIPRMELTAAVLAVRLGKVLLNELDCPVDNVFYWTDSTSVLKYIANEKTRFHTFVANRVTEIRETSQVNQWHYIETACNPADFASRGLRMDKFLQEKTWFNGPLFLWRERSEWSISQAFSKDLNSDDPETKKNNSCIHVSSAAARY